MEAVTALLDALPAAERAAICRPQASGAIKPALFSGGPGNRLTFVGERRGEAVWSNYPVDDVPRPGVPLEALGPAARAGVLRVLAALLSPAGFATVRAIMAADEVLYRRGTPYRSGENTYTLAIFGPPRVDAPWMLQFGGHHLALNVAIHADACVLAPVLTGALPALFEQDGATVRVLGRENDAGFALFDSLDPAQRAAASVPHPFGDLQFGPGRWDAPDPPGGLPAAGMDDRQRVLLLDLVEAWAGLLNDVHAGPRQAALAAAVDDLTFAWSGPMRREPGRNGASYFRVVGPTLALEFAPQMIGGDPTLHVHTIYRERAGDYGRLLGSR